MLAESSDKVEVATRMRAAEHDADETTHALVRRVNSTFVTPFDREDIYALASGLDDVMDLLDAIESGGGRVAGTVQELPGRGSKSGRRR